MTGLLVGCGGHRSTGSAAGDPGSQVEVVAATLADRGARTVIVLISDHGRSYATTRGAPTTERFRAGSVTKTFTATLVLELAAEGVLHLNDSIEHYLPGVVPAGRKITIRELLDHRSGLPDLSKYPDWVRQAQRSSSLRPIDVLQFAASHPLAFAPGSHWSYSNSGYIALGLIIEAVTHRTYDQELRQRVLTPLGLRNTDVATTRVPRYLHDSGFNPSLTWAAGGIVSTAPDLARFFSSLLAGRILPGPWLAEMKKTEFVGKYPGVPVTVDDGLGIFLTRTPCGRFWGHEGGILGYATTVDASGDGSRVAVISTRDLRDQAIDYRLLCRLITRSGATG